MPDMETVTSLPPSHRPVFEIHLISHGFIAEEYGSFAIDENRSAIWPSNDVPSNVVPRSPYGNVVFASWNSGSLDGADLDDVLVFGKHVKELHNGGVDTHGAVDVFVDFVSVA